MVKRWIVCLGLALATAGLVGCGGGGEAVTPVAMNEESVGDYVSDVLDMDYAGALGVQNQLMLGAFNLEGTEHAITPGQAAELLPLWQALRGGVTAQAEVEAVVRQIESAMTQEQLAAIAEMQLTQEDMQAWIDEQGVARGVGGDPDVRATRQAAGGNAGLPPEGEMPAEMAGAQAQFENMSEEERAAMRATVQAGGGRQGRGGVARLGEGAGDAGGPGGGILLNPLIELLAERATE